MGVGVSWNLPKHGAVQCGAMPDLDSYLVRHALTVAREHGYAEVSLEVDGSSFSATLDPRKQPKRASGLAAVSTGEPEEPQAKAVKSTLVGYLQKVSTKPGDTVKKGDVVAVVTALGLANDIESSVSGTVTEIVHRDGEAVQYGEPILLVMPE